MGIVVGRSKSLLFAGAVLVVLGLVACAQEPTPTQVPPTPIEAQVALLPGAPSVVKGPTFVVAALADNLQILRHADYYTDGDDDDVQIQDAINALPAGGGRVVEYLQIIG